MKLIIAGGREVKPDVGIDLIRKAVGTSGWTEEITEIVHGGASGIDSAAEQYAIGKWPRKCFPANWKEFGKSAGPRRNREMAEYADRLIAIWDGQSRGTKNMIETMRAHGKPVFVFRY